MRRTHVPPNVTRSTKLWGAQCSPELAFRSTDIRVPANLIFLAMFSIVNEWGDILINWPNCLFGIKVNNT